MGSMHLASKQDAVKKRVIGFKIVNNYLEYVNVRVPLPFIKRP